MGDQAMYQFLINVIRPSIWTYHWVFDLWFSDVTDYTWPINGGSLT